MLRIGRVGGAHGVRGLFKVKSFTVPPQNIAHYGPVCLEDGQRMTLNVRGEVKGMLLCSAEGVASRAQAEQLKGHALFIARDALPELPAPESPETESRKNTPEQKTEMYHADLIGLKVCDSDGHEKGLIIGLFDFGGGEIVEIQSPQKGQTEFLPFHAPFLKRVDLNAGQVIIDAKNMDDEDD